MSGYCARCVGGALPGDPCAASPNAPRAMGKTWAEQAIEQWEMMEDEIEAAKLLNEIMREPWTRREPRRLFRATVKLRRLEQHEKRRARVRAALNRLYYVEGVIWPFGYAERASLRPPREITR